MQKSLTHVEREPYNHQLRDHAKKVRSAPQLTQQHAIRSPSHEALSYGISDRSVETYSIQDGIHKSNRRE